MATRRCLRDPTHSSVWRCPCASGGDFCSLCILDHLGTIELTHSPTPIDPPVGQKVCGRCHGQPPESIRFNYELCLCSACAGEMRISRMAGEALPPGFGAEAGEAVFPPEENRPQAPRSMLRAVLGEKKSDIQNTLRRLFDNMNSFEDIIAQAFELEGKLAESQAEVLKLKTRLAEALGARADNMGVQSMLERLEAVSRENGELRLANSNYAAEVRDLKEKLSSRPERPTGEVGLSETVQQELQKTIETLKGIVDVKNQEIANMMRTTMEGVAEKDAEIAYLRSEVFSLKNSELAGLNTLMNTEFEGLKTEISNLKEDIVKQTKTAVIKVSEVMPLLSRLEDLRLKDDKTMEMVREMAVLGAEDKLEEDLVKEAASTFSPLIKLVGPSNTAAEFFQIMTKRLSDKREVGCREMHWTREIYDIVKSDERAKEALLEFMKLLKSGDSAFENMVELVKQLVGLADAQSICELLIGTCKYFANPPENDPWKAAFMSIRKDWDSVEAAKRGVSAFVRCASRAHLHGSYLQFLPLLNCDQGVQTPSHLLVERLSETLPDQAVPDQLGQLIKTIADYLSSVLKKQVSIEQAAKVLTNTWHLLGEGAAEVEWVIGKMDMMVRDEAMAANLLPLLSANAQLGPTVVTWAMQEGQPDLQFALELLQEDHTEKSAKAAQFLKYVAANPQPLVQTAKSLRQKLGKDIFGLLLALKGEDLNSVLPILDQLTSAREWVAQTTALLPVSAPLALRVYAVHSDLVRRGAQSPTEATLGRDLMEAFKTMPKLEDSLALLEAVSNTLKVDGVQYAQIGNILKYWLLFRRTQPGNPFVTTLTIQLLGILREKSQEIGKLLELLSISEKTSSHTPLVLLLAKVYLDNRQLLLRNSYKFPEEVVSALKVMKELSAAQRADLEQLTQRVTGTLSLGAALPFLEGAYTQCSESTNLLKLLDNHTLLLEEMGRLKVSGHYQKLLRLARPDTASGVSRLAALIVYLETLEIAQIDLPQWPNPLFVQSPPFGNFLTSVESMVKKHSELCRVGYLLLQTISPALDQIALFVPQMARDLMDAGARPECIATFCNMVLRDADIRSVMEMLRAQWKPTVTSDLALVLNTTQVTKSSVENVCSPQGNLSVQGNLLARVQTGDVSLFDFHNRTWGPPMPLTPPIQRESCCAWTFLDSTQLFVCGGMRQAGLYVSSSSSGSDLKVAYLLVYGSPNWTSIQLPDMITARYEHGVLYLAQFNSVFVFGGYTGGCNLLSSR